MFVGSLSCDVVRFDSNGIETNFSATLYEQPFAPDVVTRGVCLDENGNVYVSGITGFPTPSDTRRAIIEKFNFELTIGTEWKDLTTELGIANVTDGDLIRFPMTVDGSGHLYFAGTPGAHLAASSLELYQFSIATGTLLKQWTIDSNFVFANTNIVYLETDPDGTIIVGFIDRFYRFDPVTETKTGPYEPRGVNLSGSLVQAGPTLNIAVLDNGDILIPTSEYNPITHVNNDENVWRFSKFFVFKQRYSLPGPLEGTGVNNYGPSIFIRLRTVTRGLTNSYFWTGDHLGINAISPPPVNKVLRVDLSSNTLTRQGTMITNFGSEGIFDMAVCLKRQHPTKIRIAQATLIGAN